METSDSVMKYDKKVKSKKNIYIKDETSLGDAYSIRQMRT